MSHENQPSAPGNPEQNVSAGQRISGEQSFSRIPKSEVYTGRQFEGTPRGSSPENPYSVAELRRVLGTPEGPQAMADLFKGLADVIPEALGRSQKTEDNKREENPGQGNSQ